MHLPSAILLIALAQKLPEGHPPIDDKPKRSPPPLELNAPLPPGHPPVPDGPAPKAPPTSDELIKQLDATADLKTKEKTFEVAAALGKLYYAHGRWPEAVEFLTQAVVKAEPTRQLYFEQRSKAARQKKPVPPASSVGCSPSPQTTLDSLTALAKEKAKANDAAAAAACARAALHPLMEVDAMLANAKFVVGDAGGALAVHERQLELFESNPEAIYGRAAILLDTRGDDLEALRQAKAGFERYLRDFGMAPKAKQAKAFLDRTDQAIAAGGISKLAGLPPPKPAPQMPVLTKEMIEAVQNTEVTPEMQKGFEELVVEAEEHLAKGRFQEALDNYKRVVPFQPENGRAKAGMAWAMVGLNRQPMADRVWMVAVGADPKAVDQLGETLKSKGDVKGAKALWTRLSETAPRYASETNLARKLQ